MIRATPIHVETPSPLQKSATFSGAFILSLARLTALEGIRARLPWLVIAIVVAALGMAQFLTQVSLIEAEEIRSSVLAAGLRAAAVFITVVFVTTSIARETADKVTELLLSQPVPRWAYFAGKLLGYFLIAVAVGTAFALPLWISAPHAGILPWAFSLLCELAIMTVLSLFFALSFSQSVGAISAAAGFYLLSRSMASLQLIADASLQSPQVSTTDQLVAAIVQATALVLPALDRFTLSSWLLSPPDIAGLLDLSAQTAVYVVLLAMASLFDLYRRNF